MGRAYGQAFALSQIPLTSSRRPCCARCAALVQGASPRGQATPISRRVASGPGAAAAGAQGDPAWFNPLDPQKARPCCRQRNGAVPRNAVLRSDALLIGISHPSAPAATAAALC